MSNIAPNVSLDDKYTLKTGRAWMTGIQALVRLPMLQRERDRAASEMQISGIVGKLDPATAAMAKYWCTDMQCKVIDDCLQLHGGSGYMLEYPITRAYADARVQRIYGGTNEIMKEVIGRSL